MYEMSQSTWSVPCKQSRSPQALLRRRLVRVIPISHEENLRHEVPKGEKRVSGEGEIELPDPSAGFGSVVNLLCTNDNPLQNVGLNIKIKIIYVHLQLLGF